MVKTLGIVFGIVFLAVGILGFVQGPQMGDGRMLLGIFHVNTAHNFVHIGSGVIFLLASLGGGARLWFKLFGAIYALVAVLGLLHLGQDVNLLGLVSNNDADTWLHIGLAVVMLLIGFVVKDTATTT
jgi:hypothetical protein